MNPKIYPDQLPQFYISDSIGGQPVTMMRDISDPFVRHSVRINWLDRFKSLFRSDYVVEVTISGNNAAVFNIMNALKLTRREFGEMLSAETEDTKND